MAFFCSICAEESTRICVRCTKDTCANHLCEKCGRCSDCCECEVALAEAPRVVPSVRAAVAAGITKPEPAPEPPPGPEPDPFSVEEPEPETPEQSQPAE